MIWSWGLAVLLNSLCLLKSYSFFEASLLAQKNRPANAGNIGSIPESGRFPWRSKGQPAPAFLPGNSHGQRSLEGYSPWGHKTARHDLATKQQFWPKPSAFRSHFGRKTVCYSLASSWIAPWTARRSNQSILKEISPEYSLKGLMLKLKLQYFGHLMWRTDSFEKTLMLGKIEGGRRREQQRRKWLDGIANSWTWVWVNSGVGDGQGGLACCSPWGHKASDVTEWLNWTELLHWCPLVILVLLHIIVFMFHLPSFISTVYSTM